MSLVAQFHKSAYEQYLLLRIWHNSRFVLVRKKSSRGSLPDFILGNGISDEFFSLDIQVPTVKNLQSIDQCLVYETTLLLMKFNDMSGTHLPRSG